MDQLAAAVVKCGDIGESPHQKLEFTQAGDGRMVVERVLSFLVEGFAGLREPGFCSGGEVAADLITVGVLSVFCPEPAVFEVQQLTRAHWAGRLAGSLLFRLGKTLWLLSG